MGNEKLDLDRLVWFEIAAGMAGKFRGAEIGGKALGIAANNESFDLFQTLRPKRIEADESIYWSKPAFPEARRIELVVPFQEKAIGFIRDHLQEGQVPVVVTGDHSNAVSVATAVKLIHPGKTQGIVWIDAHADLHSPFTTPSGNLHGMCLASILALTHKERANKEVSPEAEKLWESWCQLGGISPKVEFKNLVYIAIRDLEDEEWEIIKDLGIKYITVEEVSKHGIGWVLDEVKKKMAQVDHFSVSFDVDSMDGRLVRGTGTPVDDGLSFVQASGILRGLRDMEGFAGIEFTEINPLLDLGNTTAKVAARLLNGFMTE